MEKTRLSCGAVIVAAGTASRMGGIDKVMANLGGKPMICRTVEAFAQCREIDEIVVVTRQDLIPQVQSLCGQFAKVKAVVAGGSNRVASVQAGLEALSADMALSAIHDGARPLADSAFIDNVISYAYKTNAAAPAVPVKDTIKIAHDGKVESTPDRSTLFAVQTPQVFDAQLLSAALQSARDSGAAITDDCSAVERLGKVVVDNKIRCGYVNVAFRLIYKIKEGVLARGTLV